MNNFALRRRQIDFHAYVTTSPVLVIREHYFSKGKGLTRHAVYFTELFARENYFEILRANANGKWDNDIQKGLQNKYTTGGRIHNCICASQSNAFLQLVQDIPLSI